MYSLATSQFCHIGIHTRMKKKLINTVKLKSQDDDYHLGSIKSMAIDRSNSAIWIIRKQNH